MIAKLLNMRGWPGSDLQYSVMNGGNAAVNGESVAVNGGSPVTTSSKLPKHSPPGQSYR